MSSQQTSKPVIGSLSVSPNPVVAGTAVSLTANNVGESGGTIASVAFYFETNGTPGLQTTGSQPDVSLGTDTSSAGGWTDAGLDTTGLPNGPYMFYAVATDTTGNTSAAASTILTVQSTTAGTPVIGSLSVSPNPVTAGTVVALTANNVSETGGTIASVSFYLEVNGTPGLQTTGSTPDAILKTDTTGSDGWTVTNLDTTGLAAGPYTFYAVATDTNGNTSATASAVLTISGSNLKAPAITTQPQSHSVAAGATVSFTAAASGNPTPTVQWQVSTDAGSTFTDISGATSATYSFIASANQSGNLFRAVFTNSQGSAHTNSATLTVTSAALPDLVPYQPTGWSAPLVVSTTSGVFTTAATITSSQTLYIDSAMFNNGPGTAATGIKNEVLIDGIVVSTWTTNGATPTNYYAHDDNVQVNPLTAGKHVVKFITNYDDAIPESNTGNNSYTLNVTVTGTLSAPLITMQPTNQAGTTGSTITFTASASGNPTPTVQWQVSTNNGSTYTNISGATSTTYRFTSSAPQNGNLFRAVFTNSQGTAISSAAKLTLSAALDGTRGDNSAAAPLRHDGRHSHIHRYRFRQSYPHRAMASQRQPRRDLYQYSWSNFRHLQLHCVGSPNRRVIPRGLHQFQRRGGEQCRDVDGHLRDCFRQHHRHGL